MNILTRWVKRRRCLAIAGLLAIIADTPPVFPHDGSPSFEDRVQAQEAIDRVYYAHRLWPKENPGPKPPFEQMLSRAQIESKVKDYLKKSAALDQFWQRPLSAEQLQAELDRMAKGTRDPAALRELFDALGNDPRHVAECLARPVLADRLIHEWYARDVRFHAETLRRAEEARAALVQGGAWAGPGSTVQKITYRIAAPDRETVERTAGDAAIAVSEEEFGKRLLEAPNEGEYSAVRETADAWVVLRSLKKMAAEITLEIHAFPKTAIESWLAGLDDRALPAVNAGENASFSLPPVPEALCAEGWDNGMLQNVPPDPRMYHTAVWTGTELIIWGGIDGYPKNTGARYNPLTDSWIPTSTALNVPTPRSEHAAVWTGTEMIVWGGGGDNTGGRYNPTDDTWTATSVGANVPPARWSVKAVWTGTEMIVWGGQEPTHIYTNTGGRYNPSTDAWAPTSTGANVPEARVLHTVVWTGSEMVVWGGMSSIGFDRTYYQSGGRYDPSTDSWMATSTGINVPMHRAQHTAVWTGSEMVVWGGLACTDNPNACFGWTAAASGGRYNPVADAWTPTNEGAGLPSGRYYHSAVWTGSLMIVWGGVDLMDIYLNTGGRYSPSGNSWTATSAGAGVPSGRANHTGTWTGSEMIIWGGEDASARMDSGGRYAPAGNSWIPTFTGAANPSRRTAHSAIWTGTEMIVWGGTYATGGYHNSGGRYNFATDSWTATSTGANVPTARSSPAAVWAGSEMIVWGGFNGAGVNTGGRYNPSTNAWLATSTGTNVPTVRYAHSGIWMGSEMIIWGGIAGATPNPTNTGGRYRPGTDSWLPTSTGTSVPSSRYNHKAVWTGSKMIVWGGYSGASYINTGGLFTPSADSWTPTSTGTNVPAGRVGHTVVWTGSQMIVWGGYSYAGQAYYFNTGGRYDLAADSWLSTSEGTGVPAGRSGHTAVWTGDEMIVWGGYSPVGQHNYLYSGGRYDASMDGWNPTSTGATVPSGRVGHRAVWTGSMMLVWGGDDDSREFRDGGRYNPQSFLPPAPEAGNSGPICVGQTLDLTASTVAGASYHWTGPNGFTSNEQYPSIAAASAAASGIYRVTSTVGECTSLPASTEAVVHAPPVPGIVGPSNPCPASISSLSTEPGMSEYQWYREGVPIGGANADTLSADQSGTYTVSYTDGNGCAGMSDPKTVIIEACFPQIEFDAGFDPALSLVQRCGDGDGGVEPGEEWQLTVQLKNTGNSPATDVTAVLGVNAASPVSAAIFGNPAAFGTIAGDGGTATADYRFLVPPEAPCSQVIVFDLTAILSSESAYPDRIPAFSVQVTSTAISTETGTLLVSPLIASGSVAASNWSPGYSLVMPIESASLASTGQYEQKPSGDVVLFGPDDFADANNWVSTGGALAAEAKCPASSPVPSDAYYQIARNNIVTLAGAVSTVGYTDIRVLFAGGVQNAGATLYFEWSPNGATWHDGGWSTSSTAWLCDQIVALPPEADGKAGFKVRFWVAGSTGAHRGKVDYVQIIGMAPASGSWTTNTQVSLVDPLSTVTVLKEFGTPDAGPYDVMPYYTGPGTYQIRLAENLGGTATLTDGSMVVRKSVVHCDVSSCVGTVSPPPVTALGEGAARFAKNPDGNTLRITFDAVSCNASKAILLYGDFGSLAGYAGCADDDLGNTGQDSAVDASGLDNAWFNIVWAQGGTAGHPGFGYDGTAGVARSWAAASLCGMAEDDQTHATCP